MNDLEKAKTQHKKLCKKWTVQIKICEFEANHMDEIVEFHKKKFLRKSELFASALEEQKNCKKKWTKLLEPFESKSNKLSKKSKDWRRNHD